MFDKQEDVQKDDFRYDDKITIRETLFNAFKSHGQKRSNVNKVETEKTTNNKKEVTVILKSSL